MIGNQFDEVLQFVHRAEEAVIQAQANTSPQEFQHAHNSLMQAQQAVNEMIRNSGTVIPEQRRQLERAQELLKHLFEAQDSIQK